MFPMFDHRRRDVSPAQVFVVGIDVAGPGDRDRPAARRRRAISTYDAAQEDVESSARGASAPLAWYAEDEWIREGFGEAFYRRQQADRRSSP
jgi:hypothetical protein